MSDKLNVLFITSDQQHYETIGKFNKKIKTPNIDRIIDEGVYMNRAYAVNPTCTPTRASWITGKYPSQHGAWTLGTKLAESQHTFGEDFTAAGYETALIGKAHFQPLASTEKYPSLEAYPILQDLEFWKTFHGPFYGFNHVELARNHTTEAHVGQHYALWLEEKGCKNWRDYFLQPTGNMTKESPRLHWDIPEEYHYDAWIAERTNAMLENYAAQDKPFFLWASFFDPHPEYYAPSPWDTMYNPDDMEVKGLFDSEHLRNSDFHRLSQCKQPDTSQYGKWLHGVHSHLYDEKELKKKIAVYYGMVSLMDKYIGKILDKLDELGLSENTLVVFTTDHGHYYGQHGLIAKGPFMFDDLVKVPFAARLKGVIPAGKISDAIMSSVDFMQTVLDFCGIEAPDGVAGVSQKKALVNPGESVRDWAIVEHNHQRGKVNVRTYINKRYKLSIYLNQPRGELFDLEADPEEHYNLFDNPEYNEIKTRLLTEFIQAEMEKEPLFMPRIAIA